MSLRDGTVQELFVALVDGDGDGKRHLLVDDDAVAVIGFIHPKEKRERSYHCFPGGTNEGY